MDCFRRHSTCSNGRCVCSRNHFPVTLRFGDVSVPPQVICLHGHVPRRTIGEPCSTSYPFSDGVCYESLICSTRCGQEPVCVDPTDNRPLPTTARPGRQNRLATYGDSCYSDSDCFDGKGGFTCSKPTTCDPYRQLVGSCQCNEQTHFWNGTNCVLKPAGVPLGQPCFQYQQNDFQGNCKAKNTICASGICMCRHGFKPGPLGDDCVSNWKTQYLGERCHDSVQCHYNMRCVNSKCSCQGVGVPSAKIQGLYGGFTLNAVVSCDEVRAGDRCTSNVDCSGVHNAKCSSSTQRCECVDGYLATIVRTEKQIDIWCVPSSHRFRQAGETCLHKQHPSEHLTQFEKPSREQVEPHLCHSELFCSKCSEYRNSSICVAMESAPLEPEIEKRYKHVGEMILRHPLFTYFLLFQIRNESQHSLTSVGVKQTTAGIVETSTKSSVIAQTTLESQVSRRKIRKRKRRTKKPKTTTTPVTSPSSTTTEMTTTTITTEMESFPTTTTSNSFSEIFSSSMTEDVGKDESLKLPIEEMFNNGIKIDYDGSGTISTTEFPSYHYNYENYIEEEEAMLKVQPKNNNNELVDDENGEDDSDYINYDEYQEKIDIEAEEERMLLERERIVQQALNASDVPPGIKVIHQKVDPQELALFKSELPPQRHEQIILEQEKVAFLPFIF